MKRIISISTVMVISFLFISQYCNCQLKTKIDKVTGDTLYISPVETIFRKPSIAGTAGEKLEFSVSKAKDVRVFTLIARTGSSKTILIEPENELIIRLGNDSLVKLHPAKSEVSDYDYSIKGAYWTVHYLLDDNSINNLAGAPVKYLRVTHSDGRIDYELKDKFQNLIGDGISLLK